MKSKVAQHGLYQKLRISLILNRITQPMINLAINELKKRRNFVIYAIIGVSGATIDYVTFLIMMQWIPVHYLVINSISTTLGITNNFFLNAHFNFCVKDQMLRRFLSFYSVGLVGMALSSVLLYTTVDLLGVSPAIAKALIIFIIVILQYNLNKRLSFRRAS